MASPGWAQGPSHSEETLGGLGRRSRLRTPALAASALAPGPAVSPQHAHAGSRISGWPPPAGLYLRLPASPLSPRCAFTCSLCLCVFVQVCGLWPGCSGQSAVLGQLPAEPAPPPSPFSRSRHAHFFLGTLLIPATWPRPGGPEPLGSFCLEGTAGLGVDREAKDRLGDTV